MRNLGKKKKKKTQPFQKISHLYIVFINQNFYPMKRFCIFLFFGLILSYTSVAQEKAYFPYFEMINMHPDYQYSVSKLFKTYVDNNSHYEVVIPPKPDKIYSPETKAETMKKAKQHQADYFIKGELNALDEIVIVSVSVYETANGNKIWSDMLKAYTPDDLDPVMLRLSKTMGTGKKASDESDIYSVTEYESPELDKVSANKNFGVYIGSVYTPFKGVENNFSSGFGVKFSYDTRDLLFDLNGELYFQDINIYNFNLVALYPFSKKKNTPYLGGGIGYGGMNITKEQASPDNYHYDYFEKRYSGSGLSFFGKAGYLFNRTSDVNVRIEVGPYITAYEIDNQLPYGFMLNMVLSF